VRYSTPPRRGSHALFCCLLDTANETSLKECFQKASQEMPAEMLGTTRARVNLLMNKFRKLGFIKYNGGVQINASLLSVVLHD
jgi:CRP/FNR family cyclic AMP-dependent transcriptional regulator